MPDFSFSTTSHFPEKMSVYRRMLDEDIARMEGRIWPEEEVKVVGVAKPGHPQVIIAPVLAVSCAVSKLKKHKEYAESCYGGSVHEEESSELLGETGAKQAPAAQLGIAMSSILFRFMLLLFCVKGNNPYDVKDYEWLLGYMESEEVCSLCGNQVEVCDEVGGIGVQDLGDFWPPYGIGLRQGGKTTPPCTHQYFVEGASC